MEAVRSRRRRRPARTALARLVSTGSRATPMQRANHFCRLRVQTRTSSVGAARPLPPSADIGLGEAVLAFANCGRAVAHVRGSYGPNADLGSETTRLSHR